MHFILFIMVLLISQTATALQLSARQLLAQSEQLLVVRTPTWESVNGQLQFYQRASSQAKWQRVGQPVAVVVGKNGMGWGVKLIANNWPGPIKQEGDGRSPVGVFQLGPAFGFAANPGSWLKLAYFPLTDTSVCIDDEKSQYYNQLLDSAAIRRQDWRSGEPMHQVLLYHWGSVIQYNSAPVVSGAGSCIFLHRWRGPDRGTAGCVAMDETQLVTVLSRFSPRRKPVIVLLPDTAYRFLKNTWDLPALTE